ncbi:MAG: hypothetical protein IIY34_02875, partial [Clostridia bacterium]|nr:hypothetical protein [Clostridia bacterium]
PGAGCPLGVMWDLARCFLIYIFAKPSFLLENRKKQLYNPSVCFADSSRPGSPEKSSADFLGWFSKGA